MARGRSDPRSSDAFLSTFEELLEDEPTLSGVRILEEITEAGYEGSKTILDDILRELRPRYLRRHGPISGRPVAPGSCASSTSASRGERSQSVAARPAAATWSPPSFPIRGMSRCLEKLGALPRKFVWDREGAIAPKGRPTEPFLAFCGQLSVGWIVLDAGDCQAKGALERSHRFLHGNFEAGRRFANPLDFQDQLDRWCERVNARKHRSTRAVVFERLAAEREQMRALPGPMPDPDRRLGSASPAAALAAL